MSSEFDQQNLISIFVLEASDGLDALAKALHSPGGAIPTPQELTDQYIIAHRISGAAALYGFRGVAQLAEHLETLLEQDTPTPAAHWDRAINVMRHITHSLQAIVRAIGQNGVEDAEAVARCWASIKQQEGKETDTSTTSIMAEVYVHPGLDADILSYFIPEAEEHLDAINELIRVLRNKRDDEDAIYRLFRTTHTLKGSAYTVGFHVIGDVAHPMEDCMLAVYEKRRSLSDGLLDLLTNAEKLIRLLLRSDSADVPRLQRDVPVLVRRLTQMSENAIVDASEEAVSPSIETAGFRSDQSEAVVNIEMPDTDLPDEYLIPDLDSEVWSYFIPEAQEHCELLEADLLKLEKDPRDRELINQVFRTAHTLKGSAYTVGFRSIGDLVHYVEDFMGAVRDGRISVLSGHTDLMLRAIDVVRVLMQRDHTAVVEIRQQFHAARSELKQWEQGTSIESTAASEAVDMGEGGALAQSRRDERHSQGKSQDAKTADDREVVRVSYARLERLMNLVGDLLTGRSRLEERLRVVERRSRQVLAFKNRLVDAVQSFADKHTFTYQEAPSSSIAPAGRGFPLLDDFGNLELDKYDDFNILARRIGEITADIGESMAQLDGSIKNAKNEMTRLQQLTLLMRDEVARSRRVLIGTLFTRFRRAVREIARASNKEVSLVTSGEQTEVDTKIVERLVDPLVHLVRNAVYHGIEPATDRIAKGKPAVGTVYLHATHRGNSIIIEVEDDGAGLDLEKIRAKAFTMELAPVHEIQAMSDTDVLQLIFQPGFSTADTIGEQAGRGVGLDVVKRVIEGMNGRIDVDSEPGVGTKFTLNLPLTLVIGTALFVRVGAERYAIPLLSIQEVTVPTPSSMREDGARTFLQMDDKLIEVQPLYHLLRRESGSITWTMPTVIVRTAGAPMGLAVDELLGRQEIVMKPLESLPFLNQSLFGGATIDPEGRVVLVIDPSRLAPRPTKESGARRAFVKVHSLPEQPVGNASVNDSNEARLLLIDDSLSIRKFVGRMLESAGYPFDTAVDGEDGLRKTLATNYRMILTDLEMPKLNGFEVIQALRSRPETRETPVVVMTTRARDKHRQMALNLGANSYISKPVEERMLLYEVERWLGKAQALRK